MIIAETSLIFYRFPTSMGVGRTGGLWTLPASALRLCMRPRLHHRQQLNHLQGFTQGGHRGGGVWNRAMDSTLLGPLLRPPARVCLRGSPFLLTRTLRAMRLCAWKLEAPTSSCLRRTICSMLVAQADMWQQRSGQAAQWPC